MATYLVTGSMGCIGAWTLHHLVRQGKQVVSFDLSDNRHRLNLLMTPEAQQAITFVQGDLSDSAGVLAAFQAHGITHVIHLAALQVPFCKADPVAGARVNVVGTVNIFQAAQQTRVKHVALASSVAVYGPPEVYPPGLLAPDAPYDPRTLYGVYKVANEGTARIYWQDHGISSATLRPYTVYGVGRDQGLTSEPTEAMLAAAAGQDYHISFGGKMQFHYASDVARQFIAASETPLEGALGFNLGTPVVSVAEMAALIQQVKPGVRITHGDDPLPFPDGAQGTLPQDVTVTPLDEGVRETITHFESLLTEGKITL